MQCSFYYQNVFILTLTAYLTWFLPTFGHAHLNDNISLKIWTLIEIYLHGTEHNGHPKQSIHSDDSNNNDTDSLWVG